MVLKRYGHPMKHNVREAVTKFPDLRMTGTDAVDMAAPDGACAVHEISQSDRGIAAHHIAADATKKATGRIRTDNLRFTKLTGSVLQGPLNLSNAPKNGDSGPSGYYQ